MEPLYRDPVLAELIEEHGEIALEPHPRPYERFVISVINQQLSTASAAAIQERVFERFDVVPEAMIEADEDALREAGLSRQKIEYIRNISEAFANGEVDLDRFAEMTDDEVIEVLTEIRGVGVWTAKMFCLSCLAREDVFPVEDLGIRRGMETLYGIEDREAMVEKAEEWRPYRSYASRYLWRASD